MPLLVHEVLPGSWEDLNNVIAAIRTWAGKQEGVNQTLESATGGLYAVPTGAILAWSDDVAPAGWLLCDGARVSRTEYAKLFEAIGTTHGAGDGATSFDLPDLRGRFILGTAASGTGSTLAGTGGAIDHTHAGGAHTHTVSGSTANESAHTHTGTTATGTTAILDYVTGGAGVASRTDHVHLFTTDAGSAHSHGAGTLAADSGGAVATGSSNPPFMALNYIIRT